MKTKIVSIICLVSSFAFGCSKVGRRHSMPFTATRYVAVNDLEYRWEVGCMTSEGFISTGSVLWKYDDVGPSRCDLKSISGKPLLPLGAWVALKDASTSLINAGSIDAYDRSAETYDLRGVSYVAIELKR